MAKTKMTGIGDVLDFYRRLPKKYLDATAVGEYNAAQDTMKLSKQRVPLDTGDLENSAFVSDPRYGAASATVEMGYSGIPYAARQHEDMSYQHPGGRQAKFLESAVTDMAAQTRATILAAVDHFLRTGRLPQTRGNIGGRK